MKKTILTFGFISGGILSCLMAIAMVFHDQIGFERGMVVGYTSMVVAFLLVFFGIRSYRDNVGNGTIRFGRAFVVGASIAAIAGACYVATWQVMFYNFMPDYLTKYEEFALKKARENGETEAAIALKKAEMEKFAEMYKNPLVNIAFTFIEPLPVGLVVALVSAGVLSRRRRVGASLA